LLFFKKKRIPSTHMVNGRCLGQDIAHSFGRIFPILERVSHL